MKDKSETKDRFGEAVAFAPKGPGNSRLRLAVAAPYENTKKKNDGKVWVFPLSNVRADKTYTQATPGVAGRPQAQDRFGLRLAVVNGLGQTALLIGVPHDASRATGMVNVVPLAGAGKRFWAPGFGGVTAVGDSRFGGGLASSSDS